MSMRTRSESRLVVVVVVVVVVGRAEEVGELLGRLVVAMRRAPCGLRDSFQCSLSKRYSEWTDGLVVGIAMV